MFRTDKPSIVPLSLVVIQPTPFCNIDCRYCYLPNRLDRRRMSPETAEAAFRFLLSKPDRLAKGFVIAWHGGEPTTMPLAFYEAAFARFQELTPEGVVAKQKFTTNATLLDEHWCALFKRWDVSLRISIDGPQWLHDRDRVDRRGRGTFEKVARGIDVVRAAGLPFKTISVLRDECLDHAAEMWTFFRSIGASGIEFCTEETLVAHAGADNPLQMQERARTFTRLQAFFEELLTLRDREAPDVSIREVDTLLERIPGWRGRHMRGFETVPFSIVSIAWNGDISTYSPELVEATHARYGRLVFGNVATHTWDQVLANPMLRLMYRDITEGVNNCERTCPYFDMCGGDSPAAKLFENDDLESTETLFCQLRVQAVGEVALRHLGLPSRRVAQEPVREGGH